MCRHFSCLYSVNITVQHTIYVAIVLSITNNLEGDLTCGEEKWITVGFMQLVDLLWKGLEHPWVRRLWRGRSWAQCLLEMDVGLCALGSLPGLIFTGNWLVGIKLLLKGSLQILSFASNRSLVISGQYVGGKWAKNHEVYLALI